MKLTPDARESAITQLAAERYDPRTFFIQALIEGFDSDDERLSVNDVNISNQERTDSRVRLKVRDVKTPEVTRLKLAPMPLTHAQGIDNAGHTGFEISPVGENILDEVW